MSRKRPNPLDHPPAAPSSDEEHDEDEELPEQHEEDKRPADASESEEEVGDEDDEDEEEVDDEEPVKIHPPLKPVSKIPNPQSDDESETESESAGFAIKPHTSTTPAPAAKPKNPLKRPVEDEKESKSKAKKKAKPEPDNEGGVAAKKAGSVRLWGEADEIAVLKGMIEFHEKRGLDPNSNSTAFHEFVKKVISFDVSKSQLMEKVRRLKTKYKLNAQKSEDPVFSRSHERKAFELSKTIWGSAGGNVVKNASIKKKNSSADHNGSIDVGDEEVDGEEPEEEIRPQYKPVSKTPEMKSGKKSGIDTVWSDEDEVAVLESMIEFREKKGVDPYSDSTAFHEFVKKSISFDVSKSRLMEKVKRLKNNYMLKAEDSDFSRPHERKVFELSKAVWASAGGVVVKKKTSSSDHNGKFDVVMALPNPKFTAFNTTSKQEPPQHSKQEPPQHSKVVEQGKFADLYPFLYLSLKSSSLAAMMSRDMAETMERLLVSMDKSKLQQLDKEWKKQILDEARVSMGRSDLLKKQLQLLMADWH